MDNMKNNVVETLSQVIIKPAISKPTSPLILSRYAKNFSKLNLALIADAFLNFPIAELVVGLRTGLDDRDLDISSPEACMTASCHNGILRDFPVELPNGWSSAISEASKFNDISLGLSLFWCLGAIFGELFFFLRKPSLVNFFTVALLKVLYSRIVTTGVIKIVSLYPCLYDYNDKSEREKNKQ